MALARGLPLHMAEVGRRGPIARKENAMLYYALIFLLVGLVAGALGLMCVTAIASQISWLLFLIGIVMLVIHLVADRPTRLP